MKRVTASKVAKQAQEVRHTSTDSEDLARYLDGVNLIGGEGSIDLGYIARMSDRGYNDETVNVAIVHDGSGYTPSAAIVVLDFGHPDSALQFAYEILEERERNLSTEDGRMAELESEWTEYEGQADEILTESFDGKVWTLSPEEAVNVIRNSKAAQYIDIAEVGEDAAF